MSVMGIMRSGLSITASHCNTYGFAQQHTRTEHQHRRENMELLNNAGMQDTYKVLEIFLNR